MKEKKQKKITWPRIQVCFLLRGRATRRLPSFILPPSANTVTASIPRGIERIVPSTIDISHFFIANIWTFTMCYLRCVVVNGPIGLFGYVAYRRTVSEIGTDAGTGQVVVGSMGTSYYRMGINGMRGSTIIKAVRCISRDSVNIQVSQCLWYEFQFRSRCRVFHPEK